MKPREEAKLLKATLARMDSTRKMLPEREWFYPLTWVLTVLGLLIVFKLEDLGVTSPTISTSLTMFMGMGIGWVFFAGTAVRRLADDASASGS